ncbi:hypothetical protein ABZP36_002190 [Zizania latifolia]
MRGKVAAEEEQSYEEYGVEILKLYGLKFAKGYDGVTYIKVILLGASTDQTDKFTVSDKVLATSAVFGEEIWPAAGYDQPDHVLHLSDSWPPLHEEGEEICWSSALEDAMKVGYEDFKRICTDLDLENLRKTKEFVALLKKYDESFINENAIKLLFGFNKK